ncbi:MAG: glycosyltransferase [Caldisericaceae bacterium]
MSRDLLFVSTNLYWGLPTGNQGFAKHFNDRGFRVLFVEPPYTYLALLKKSFKKRDNSERIEKICDNFYILNSFAWFPFFKKYRFFNSIDNHVFLNHIKSSFSELDFHPEIVWNYMPFLPEVLQNLNAKKVYDCVDDHSAYPGLINPDFVDELERETVKISDAVIVTNETLKDKLSLYGKQPTVLGNGVDWALFSEGLFDKPAQIKKQIIYVGAIAEWFDLNLILAVAKKLPDYKILIIGPVSVDIAKLASAPNVQFKGKMTQQEFAPILRESAAAIIPFKVNKLTERIDPLKLYEYFAAGVPVVSTRVGGTKEFPVFVADSESQFIEKIKEAIETDSNEKRLSRSMSVKQFSWETKYAIVDKIIESL